MDFTLSTYRILLGTLKQQGFSFFTFSDFVSRPSGRKIVFRHDVDKLPDNSLRFARIQEELGIKGTYYFRVVPGSWDERIIKEIANLGHEIGYHYEDLNLAAGRLRDLEPQRRRDNNKGPHDRKTARLQDHKRLENELVVIAIEGFTKNLERLRKIVPVKTICMHGSPMSRWDSRLLWKYYDYRDFGIIGEPYFDVNFDEVLYLTDTGRRWGGESVAIRDKVQGAGCRVQGGNPFGDWKVKPVQYRKETESGGDEETGRKGDIETKRRSDVETKKSPSVSSPATCNMQPAPFPKFHSTSDIIQAAEQGKLPDKIMMTFHPQRWTDKPIPWVKELVWQNVKNGGKFFLVKMRD